jgi:hypothetical protein
MSPKETFLESLARCQERPGFILDFYRKFLASSDEIAFKFRFTDFDQQKGMLLHSLQLCAAATAGDPEGLASLTQRAETHSRAHLGIKPQLYDLWLQAAIETRAITIHPGVHTSRQPGGRLSASRSST